MVARAKINPAMMAWARKRAGFTDGYEETLPKDIKSKYEAWENGEIEPTWVQLRKVSKKYSLPTAFFFMESVPELDDLPKLINYRKLDAEILFENNSPELIKQIRKSESRREHYLDLLYELELKIPSFETYDGPLDKEHVSNYIRETLVVSLDTQKSWIRKNGNLDKKHYNFLNRWKEIVTEKMGVLIFETEGVSLNEMRGLCIFYKEIPIILLNGKDSVNGRIFSLFHELTHLLLGQSAICGDDDNIEEEVFCNGVAGRFLVPKDDLSKNVNVENVLSKRSINGLSHLYGVSEHVILRRLYDSHYISRFDYTSMVKDYEDNLDNNSKGSGGSYLNNQVKYNGETYCAIVLDAYENGIINGGDFSKFTNINKKFIPDLQKRIYGGEQ